MNTTGLRPELATALSDARLQFHHAVQLATAAGISYLPPKPDDSHTNLEWLPGDGRLASNRIPSSKPFRIAVRAADLELSLLDTNDVVLASMALNQRTIGDAAGWLRRQLPELGADPRLFTLTRHYEIPHHAVDDGAPFDTSDTMAFAQLAAWYDIAAMILESMQDLSGHTSDVRCWPHHFDIGVLIDVEPGKTIGVGMEPGDVYYDEPYFYVNTTPALTSAPSVALPCGGAWHTREWIGAVLRGSVLSGDSAAEEIRAFLVTSVAAVRDVMA
jgi:hypothetical protein